MNFTNLEDVIRYHIQLPSNCKSNGFFQVLCKVCNDHGGKGKRAGFIFDSNGVVGYNCFNCGIKTKYDPSDNSTISAKMKSVLASFGIEENEYKFIHLENIKNNNSLKIKKTNKNNNLEPQIITLPDHFYKLNNNSNDIWSQIALEFLNLRKINFKDYPFYLSTNKEWLGRLIIPIYKDNNLIFYQGRKMDECIEGQKYKSPIISKTCVFFNYAEIFKNTNLPLFITEGFFDALCVNGVAIFGNSLTKQQIEILNKSKRKKVYIPDKYGSGDIGAEQALENNWSLGLPEIGQCKDINEAIVKYGKIYTIKSLMDNIYEGISAKAKLGFFTYDKKTGHK